MASLRRHNDPASVGNGPPAYAMITVFRDREKAFWLLQTVGWTGYAAVRMFHGVTLSRGIEYLNTTLVATITGFLLSTLMRYLFRGVRDRQLTVVLLSAVVISGIFGLAFSAIEVLAASVYDPLFQEGQFPIFGNAMFEGSVLLSWTALYFGFNYYRELQEQRVQTVRAAAMAHEAQLKMLRYQLNPHFLFNTLNAISTLVLERDIAVANKMLTKLSAFLRYTLVNQPNQKVTLEQELYALGLYLDIEKVRFQDRLSVDLDIDDRARAALIPSLLMQPLIENAIKYAIAPSEDGGHISFSARVRDHHLHLALKDDGPGLQNAPDPAAAAKSSGVGIPNTRARLAEIYGQDHEFQLKNLDPRGLEVIIVIPCEFQTRSDRQAA